MHMKSRVTLTLDPVISHRAKIKAREQGTSFSGLIEQLLSEVIEEPTSSKRVYHADRWRGAFTLSDEKSPKMDYLKKKYGLDAP